jgi:predicted Mrr-cat superfamily restriction endonuclease
MAIWISRGGSKGQFEQQMLEKGVIVMAWETIPDISQYRDRARLERFYRGFYPDGADQAIAVHVGELFAFVNTAEIGDLVVVPFKNQPHFAVGQIAGDYAFRPGLIDDAPHILQVQWLRTNIPRTTLEADLGRALAARLTFSQSRQPDAERRFRQIASTVV